MQDKSLDDRNLTSKVTTFYLPYFFGVLYIVLGLIALWEGDTSDYLFWYALVQSLWGSVYILTGYFMRKQISLAFYFLILLIISHSLLFDIYLRIAIRNRNIYFLGIIVSIVWIIHTLMMLKYEKKKW
jgi:uncharacterized membrane protein HdeD (DUF308 family)